MHEFCDKEGKNEGHWRQVNIGYGRGCGSGIYILKQDVLEGLVHLALLSAESMKTYFVYILSNAYRTVFYIGVTNNLEVRVLQHRRGSDKAFSSKYNCFELVYYEDFTDINAAIEREKQLKRWRREWKLELIRKQNPEMVDLAKGWY